MVHTPDGRDESAAIRSLDEGGVLRWADADVSGLYRFSAGSPTADQLVAVNPPALNQAQQASPSDLRGPGPKTSKRPIPTGISKSSPICTRSYTLPAPRPSSSMSHSALPWPMYCYWRCWPSFSAKSCWRGCSAITAPSTLEEEAARGKTSRAGVGW